MTITRAVEVGRAPYTWHDMAPLDGDGWIAYQIAEGWHMRIFRSTGKILVLAPPESTIPLPVIDGDLALAILSAIEAGAVGTAVEMFRDYLVVAGAIR